VIISEFLDHCGASQSLAAAAAAAALGAPTLK